MMKHAAIFLLASNLVVPGKSVLFGQWVQTSLDSGYVNCFAVSGTNLFAGAGDRYYGGDGGDVFRSTDNGANWAMVDSGLAGTPVLSLAPSRTDLLAGTPSGFFRSTNDGTSWTAADSGLTSIWVNALAIFATDSRTGGRDLFAATTVFCGYGDWCGGGIFLSTNTGTSWTAVNNGFAKDSCDTTVYSFVSTLAVNGTNILAGTWSNCGTGRLFLTTNNGTNWTAVDSGLNNNPVTALVVSGANLFAGTPIAGVFLSSNNGTSWIAVNNGFPKAPYDTTRYASVNAFAVSGTNLFAGTGYPYPGGVCLSTNNGTSWTAVNTGLTNPSVYALAVSGTNLYAGTYGGGVWRRPLSEMITSVETPSAGLPTHFSLQQNYPNPFNPTTVIGYRVQGSGYGVVSLKVYDILGREVATLVNERKAPGSYEVTFDGAGISSGVYFYSLVAGSLVETKRILLLR